MVRSSSLSDREVLARIYQAHASRVYGFLLARCGSEQLAEDLTADTFVAAARALASGASAKIDGTWLVTVARRRLIDHWRRSATYDEKIALLAGGGLRSDAVPLDDLDRGHVHAAIQSLPVRQAAALSLRYLDDLSLAEIAELLDISYQAAGSLVTRARASFETAYRALEDPHE